MFFTYFFSTGPTLRCSLQVLHLRNKRSKNDRIFFYSVAHFDSPFLNRLNIDDRSLAAAVESLWIQTARSGEALWGFYPKCRLSEWKQSLATANVETARPSLETTRRHCGNGDKGLNYFLKGIIQVRSFSPFHEKTQTLFLRKVLRS